ncbi:hypothetical protein L484_006725 [Morus notabilis]|uniref:Sugar phosphate transporter domain-containing protein n=1 Tax=Morus notabilis TaxID=981085 RepID=W9RQC2_9ROSA|nr:hypothetical protein L484_006725 [Morus notabilis]
MSSTGKAEKKAAIDAASWMFNVVTSVGIILVNKALMATYGFSFATTLTGLHFGTTTLLTSVLRWLGYIQPSHLPLSDLLKFVLFANFSIVGMNVSLMWNSVGFYQIAKLSMIPVSCFLEVVLDHVRYSRDTKLSILLVLIGVGVCTVTDVSVNAKGFIAALVAVWSTALQQYPTSENPNPFFMTKFGMATERQSSTSEVTSNPKTAALASSSHGGPDTPSLLITGHKLNGQNYLQWSQSVMMFICGRGKDEYLNGEVTIP